MYILRVVDCVVVVAVVVVIDCDVSGGGRESRIFVRSTRENISDKYIVCFVLFG